MNKFVTTGAAVLFIIALLNIAGWIESLESRDRARHCVFLNVDGATTDMEFQDLESRCKKLAGYGGEL